VPPAAVATACATHRLDARAVGDPEVDVPKREKSKRLQVVISEEQDSLLTKTAYHLSNPERLVSKSEVVRLGIAMLNRAVEEGRLDPALLEALEES
jgi:hypothetical protein